MADNPSMLWRECADWLVRCDMLPPDHKVLSSQSTVIDFANTLRDGKLLCQLLNHLQPDSVDLTDVSLRPQMAQFLCLKNIRTFLNSCQKAFELKSADLFDPIMLFDLTDFGTVLQTMSRLSKVPRVLKKVSPGFPVTTDHHDYYNDSIYRNLDDVNTGSPMGEGQEWQENEDDIYACISYEDEEIYEDLLQLRPSAETTATTAQQPVLEKRDYCIRELVETEKNYVDALNMLLKHFVRPLRNVISKPEERHIIFLHIKELHEVHSGFHSDLVRATNGNGYISDCLINWKDRFVIYGEYCANLVQAQELLDKLCQREVVSRAIEDCQKDANDGRFRLRDLLSVPMQRILKYHLLLKELIKNTATTHDDYEGLERALDAMLDLAQYINEVKRDNETLQIMKAIESSIINLVMPENTELKDYGRLLKDGELKIRTHGESKTPKLRYVFVFDQVLLICKAMRGDQYTYKDSLALSKFRIEDVPNTRQERWSHFWVLVSSENKTAYHIYAKTAEIKAKWLDALRKALDNISPREARSLGHTFVMHTFEKSSKCDECCKLLRGLLFQGYHCVVCGISVHRTCLTAVRTCGAPGLPPRQPPGSRQSLSASSRARARRSYQGNKLGHLYFETYDSILVTRKISPFYWEGRREKTGQEGIFPADFVEEVGNNAYEEQEELVNVLRPPPRPLSLASRHLEEFLWFVGTMDHDTAQTQLGQMADGTFLVRISERQSGKYVISLKHDSDIKHMRVCNTPDRQSFYLSETKYFRGLVELVSWYQDNTLADSFTGLNAVLARPFRSAAGDNGTADLT